MATYLDDFDTLAASVWSKVVNGDSDVQVGSGLCYATDGVSPGEGNHIALNGTTVANASITPSFAPLAPTTVTMSTAHGYEVGETFVVQIAGAVPTTPVDINGTHIAQATTSTAYEIGFDSNSVASYSVAGTTLLPLTLSGANQKSEVVALSIAESTNHYVTLWNRLYGGTLSNGGYGFKVHWDASAARSASIIKIDKSTGLNTTVATVSGISLMDPGDDFQTLQHFRFVVYDRESVGGEGREVVCRGYVNEEDDALPTLEFVDRQSSSGSPIHRAAGTFGVQFGDAPGVLVDSFEATDEYVVPAFGIQEAGRRTLSEMRTALFELISRANNNDIDTSRANLAINHGIRQFLADLGDAALFRIKKREFALTLESDGTVELPWDVDRCLTVYDSTGKYRRYFEEQIHDGDGDRRYIKIEAGIGGTYWIKYVERFEDLDADTDVVPVPKQHDEGAILAAAIRMARHEHDPTLEAALRADYEITLRRTRKELNRRRSREKPIMAQGRVRRNRVGPHFWRWGY